MIERVSIEGGAEGIFDFLIARGVGDARVGWKKVIEGRS